MGAAGTRPLILDAGALIGLEKRDIRIGMLVEECRRRGRMIIIPASVLAQVWRGGRGTQAPIAQLLRRQSVGQVQVAALDEPASRAVGILCAVAGHSDVPDGHVAYLSRLNGRAPVITQDPLDIAKFGHDIPILPI